MSSVRDFAQDRANLAATAPRRQACIARLQDYLDRTGIHPQDFAPRIGYGYATIRHFLADRYHRISGNDSKVIEAVDAYLAQHPIVAPALLGGELYDTANIAVIREAFSRLTTKPRAMLLYGPPGSQKSFGLETEVVRYNAAAGDGPKAPRAFYVYARDGVRPLDLLKRIAVACGSRSTGNIDRILGNLKADHSGRRVIIVVDEAQHLDLKCYNTIRELLDRDPYFSLLFAGSHHVFNWLSTQSAQIEQLNSRIVQKVRLPGCTYPEAEGIVRREVGHILERQSADMASKVVAKLIAQSTVTDAYVAVPAGKPPATYINIRTLTNALDDLRTQYEAKQQPLAQESAA